MFVASVPTSIEELEAAFAAADWPVVRRAAHTLKGLFATFVAGEGEAAAKQLELAAGADGAARIACGVLVHGVREHALALRDALVGHLAGAPKPR
jgi:HPt (histidine-containing phosphotransfer) domain-containing protein